MRAVIVPSDGEKPKEKPASVVADPPARSGPARAGSSGPLGQIAFISAGAAPPPPQNLVAPPPTQHQPAAAGPPVYGVPGPARPGLGMAAPPGIMSIPGAPRMGPATSVFVPPQ
eukprot:g80.t1